MMINNYNVGCKRLSRQMSEEAVVEYLEINSNNFSKNTPYEKAIIKAFMQFGASDFSFNPGFRSNKSGRGYLKSDVKQSNFDPLYDQYKSDDGSVLVMGFHILGVPVGLYAFSEEGLFHCDPETYWIAFSTATDKESDRKMIQSYIDLPFGFSNLNYMSVTKDAVLSVADALGIETKGL